MKTEDVKVIFILASWSSGSTSVAGYLDKCGAYSCPPHLTTVDDRTPDAFEPAEYAGVVRLCLDEETLQVNQKAEGFGVFFREWIATKREMAAAAGHRFIVIKYPAQSLLLPLLMTVVPDAILVVVTRPFDKIEATRQRRKWIASYGEAGAQVIYGVTYQFLQQYGWPYIGIPYEKLRSDPTLRDRMLQFIGLEPTPAQRAEADAFLR